jgi:hypothetical protein
VVLRGTSCEDISRCCGRGARDLHSLGFKCIMSPAVSECLAGTSLKFENNRSLNVGIL